MKSNSRVLRGWRDFGVKATAIILTILLATQMVGTPAFASGALTNKQASEDIATTVDDTGVESSGTEATDTTVPGEAAGTESDPAPADSTQATEEPVVETTESATDPATETPAADPAANTVLGTESEPAPAVEQDQLASIKLDLAHGASITLSKDGNKIDDDTNPIDVPANEELKFTAQVADGWQIDKVKTVIDVVETELTADANGEYKVAADKVTDKLTVKVEAVEAEMPVEDATEGEQSKAVEDEAADPENETISANAMSFMAASRAEGQNGWKPDRRDGAFGTHYYEGTLSIGRHYYSDSSQLVGGSTSYSLDTRLISGTPQEVDVNLLALSGYDFDRAVYQNNEIKRFRISDSGDLQYSTQSYGNNWKTISDRNVGNISFYYQKSDTYTVNWYVNGELVKTDKVNEGDRPQYNRDTPDHEIGKGDEVEFAGWATEPNSRSYMSEENLPEVTGDVNYYAVFTARAFFYFVLPGKSNTSTEAKDYMYAGEGKVIVPDGLTSSSRWYNTNHPIGDYVVESPDDSEIRQGLQAAFVDYEASWTYDIDWTTINVSDTSLGYDYITKVDYDYGIHIDSSITIETDSRVTAMYAIAFPDKNVSQSTTHDRGATVEINSTVSETGSFTTDGYDYEAVISHEGDTYQFDGWYSDPTYQTKATNTVQLNESRTFYARYINTTYNLTFDANSGSFGDGASSSVTKQVAGTSINVGEAEKPAREGYTFVGWNTEKDGTGETYSTYMIMPERDVTLYAQWEKSLNEGDEITVQVIMDGNQVAANQYATPVEWTGHTEDFGSNYDGNVYKITYKYDKLNCADFYIDVDIIPDGYMVKDVYSDPDHQGPTTATGVEDAVLNITKLDSPENRWVLDNIPGGATVTVELVKDPTKWFSISYEPGAPADEVEGLPEGDDHVLSGTQQTRSGDVPTRHGYTFDGWTVVPDDLEIAEGGTFEMPAANVTFTAKWVADTSGLAITGYSDIYDGLTHGVTVSGTLGIDEVKYFDADGNEIDNQFVNVTDGAVSVTAVVSRDGYEIWSGAATVQITPAPLTIATPSAGKVFDGAPLVGDEPSASGWQDDDATQVTLAATGSITNVGSTYNTYAVSDPDGVLNNYNVIDNLGVLTVWPQSIDPTDPGDDPDPEDPTAPDPSDPDPDFPDYDPTDPDPEGPDPDQPFYTGATVDDPENVPYDGDVHQWVPTVTDNEGNTLTPGEDYTVSYDTDDFTNVGTITVTITGTGNYGGSVEKTYQITPAQITVNIENQTKVQGSADPTFTFNYSGVIEGETMAWTGEFVREVGEAVGDYAVTQGGFVLADNPAGGFDASNYTLVVNPGTLTITAATTPGGGDEGGDDTPGDTPGGGGDEGDDTPDAPGTPGTPIPVPTPAPGGGGVTPADGLTAAPADDATAEAEEAIDDAETPLAASEPIDDDATPMAAGAHRDCWVHWLMLLGILVAVVYYGGVGVRRVRFSSSLQSFEDDVLGNNETNR